jgi:hypothetical protein
MDVPQTQYRQLQPSSIVNGRYFYSTSSIGYSRYELSTDGYLRTVATGYMTKGTPTAENRHRLHIKDDTGSKNSPYIYQLMAQLFIGPPPTPAHTVDHIDRVRTNNVLSNLRWATKSEQSENQHKPKSFRSKPVTMILPDGQEYITFLSIKLFFGSEHWTPGIGEYNNNNRSYMTDACRTGRYLFGCRWKYATDSMPGEEWRLLEIPDYGMIYVSNEGRVVNLKGKFTFGRTEDRGYKTLSLNHVHYQVHRLIMAGFVGLDPRLVNHKDGNKKNNRIENLEYATDLENIEHAIKTGLRPPKTNGHKSRPILQIDPYTGTIVAKYPSGAEAARAMGVHGNSITVVCNGGRKSCRGFLWRYE